MNEEPKSIWKKSWTGWRGLFFGWLIVMASFAVILFIWLVADGTPLMESGDEARLFLAFGIVVTVIFLLVGSIRWMCCWRNFKKALFGMACLFTLFALLYAEEDWRGWHTWNQFQKSWEAKGEHFDWESVAPPPVPDDQNFAMAPIWADSVKAMLGPRNASRWKYPDDGRTNFTDRIPMLWRSDDRSYSRTNGDWTKGTFTDLKPWQAYYRTPAEVKLRSGKSVTTNEFPIAPQPQSPAQDVLLALSKFDPAVEELRQASQLPYSRFPLDYDSEDPAIILLPHLALIKRSAQVVQMRAIAELQNGETEKALGDVKLSLRLVGSVRTEPFLISHLVRFAMLQIALQPVWEGLAQHKWSDAQLAALDGELAKSNFAADYQFGVRGELGFQRREIDYLVRNRRKIFDVFNEFGNGRSSGSPFIASLIPAGWFYQNEYRCARAMIDDLPAADAKEVTFSPSASRRGEDAVTAEIRSPSPYNLLERLMLPGFGAAAIKFAYAQASVDLARTAIALERYRLAHGNFPDTLDALAPQFIAQVPHDVIGGGPLKYRRTDDGQFVLYSIGWNERDDGGKIVFQRGSTPSLDLNQGDWVWQYPQK